MAETFTIGQTIGASAANSGINAILGIGTQALGNYMNYRYNEKAANAADERTRALYRDIYSPAAQLRMLKEAGLSPGLMYAGSGVGGATPQGAQGGGTAGPHMQTPQFDILGAMQTKAYIDNLNADTREKNADAKVKEETGIEESRANISQALSKAGLDNANAKLTEAQTQATTLLNEITEKTKEFTIQEAEARVKKIKQETEKAYEETRSAKVKAEIDEKSANEVLKQKKLATTKLIAEISSIESQATLSETQAETIVEEWLTHKFNAETDRLRLEKEIEQFVTSQEQIKELTKRGQNMDFVSGLIRTIVDIAKEFIFVKMMFGNTSAVKQASKRISDATGNASSYTHTQGQLYTPNPDKGYFSMTSTR